MDDESFSTNEKIGFVKYIFDLDEENKDELMNMIQYAVISILPIVLILKAVKYFIPEEDESKGSLEILIETVGQIVFMIGMIWFSDRVIRFFPTYSGTKYGKLNPTSFLLPLLLILSTMQTKLGAKINILIERALNYLNGDAPKKEPNTNNNNNNNNNNRVSQPISEQHQPSQADFLDENQLLPSNRNLTSITSTQQQQQEQQQMESPDFNQMYQNTVNPLQNAASPVQGPIAANEGGNAFGAW